VLAWHTEYTDCAETSAGLARPQRALDQGDSKHPDFTVRKPDTILHVTNGESNDEQS
jgi:hypothetical protein